MGGNYFHTIPTSIFESWGCVGGSGWVGLGGGRRVFWPPWSDLSNRNYEWAFDTGTRCVSRWFAKAFGCSASHKCVFVRARWCEFRRSCRCRRCCVSILQDTHRSPGGPAGPGGLNPDGRGGNTAGTRRKVMADVLLGVSEYFAW